MKNYSNEVYNAKNKKINLAKKNIALATLIFKMLLRITWPPDKLTRSAEWHWKSYAYGSSVSTGSGAGRGE